MGDDALVVAKEEAARAVKACQCDVRDAYNKAWEAANANNDEDEKAFTKGKHMACVLEGTTPANCQVGEIPKVEPVELADGVPAEPCPKYKHITYVGCYGDNSYSDGWSGSGGRGSYNALAGTECDKDGVSP